LWAKRKDRLRTAINVDGTGRDKGVRGVGSAAVNNASQTFANIGKQTSTAAANTADQSYFFLYLYFVFKMNEFFFVNV